MVVIFNIFEKNKADENQQEIDNLKQELEKCKFLINRNETMFNMSTDENLIAAQIYERESLRWQYCYLLAQIKEKESHTAYKAKVKVGE